ncbi:hypothetical protein NC99_14140 [Sunxiuqinia dokdonensis]|uniref:Uncharacterized protein n=1 Tax=Sunxiuqinia dokdonensis TaxID=1409788 RepID=A0A0L8VC87_9BACT|nr:hypothetical protein NC99_14140 [Sunxiuqinia dokdonensis]
MVTKLNEYFQLILSAENFVNFKSEKKQRACNRTQKAAS